MTSARRIHEPAVVRAGVAVRAARVRRARRHLVEVLAVADHALRQRRQRREAEARRSRPGETAREAERELVLVTGEPVGRVRTAAGEVLEAVDGVEEQLAAVTTDLTTT